VLGLKNLLHVFQHLGTEHTELWAAVVDGGQTHGAQDAVWHRRRPRNLQEVTANGMEIERNHAQGAPVSFLIFCIQIENVNPVSPL
jgi:hypothetical protein